MDLGSHRPFLISGMIVIFFISGRMVRLRLIFFLSDVLIMLMFKLQTASLFKDGHVIDFENEFIKQLDLKYSSNSKLLQMLNIFIEA